MSEYWKSLPRKFCEMCKCWFADNKASIQFHERGKRHQESVQKRISDIKKKGLKDQKKQQKLDKDMAKIEKAAMAAYKKDLLRLDQSLDGTEISNSANNVVKKNTNFISPMHSGKSKPAKFKIEPPPLIIKEEPPAPPSITWYEAMSEEGHKYYWNTETSESRWEPPEEGFVSIEEQETESASTEPSGSTEENGEEETTSETIPIQEKVKKEPISTFGPQPRVDPYGQWITVVEKKVEQIDWQLPKPSEDIVEVVIPIPKEKRDTKFKEKVIGSLADTDPTEGVTFKKRKFGGSQKRNTRQRCTDDD